MPRSRESLIERVWYGGGDLSARAVRAALVPGERLYAGAVALRSTLYDRGWAKTYPAPIPTMSVGNLSVGGTGKTPMAAWFAEAIRRRGGHPAIVLRGYGGDEAAVHRVLNPWLSVVESPDRVAGVERAASAGADVAVLDDAFQHRRASRLIDVVLLSADRGAANLRLLPAGPWREPLRALGRASLVIVTRKAAGEDEVDALWRLLEPVAASTALSSVHLTADELVRVGGLDGEPERDRPQQEGDHLPMESLAGRPVHLIAAIGDPTALVRQLEHCGARVTTELFRDHHPFSASEVAGVARRIGPETLAVCTLKDAVKIGPHWPHQGPALWYVSQRVILERGGSAIEGVLDELLRARH